MGGQLLAPPRSAPAVNGQVQPLALGHERAPASRRPVAERRWTSSCRNAGGRGRERWLQAPSSRSSRSSSSSFRCSDSALPPFAGTPGLQRGAALQGCVAFFSPSSPLPGLPAEASRERRGWTQEARNNSHINIAMTGRHF